MFRRFRSGAPVIAALNLLLYAPAPCLAEAAFAFGQYGEGGWASGTGYNYGTSAEAKNTAMKNCNDRGYNCIIRGTFRGLCFALAVQDSGNGFAWQTNADAHVAAAQAQERCHGYGRPCSIRSTFCDAVAVPDTGTANPPPTTDEGTPCQRFPNLC